MRFRAYYTRDHDAVYEAPGWIEAVSDALAWATDVTGRLEAVELEEDGPDAMLHWPLPNHPTGTPPD